MSKKNDTAYDFSLFEETEKKKKSKKNRKSKKTIKADDYQALKDERKKHNPFLIAFFVMLLAVVMSIIVLMITNQMKIAELTDSISVKEKQLNEEQSITAQLSMRVESRMSLDTIESYATEKLNMKKIQPYQIEYINIYSEDTMKVYENKNDSWIDAIKSTFSDFLS